MKQFATEEAPQRFKLIIDRANAVALNRPREAFSHAARDVKTDQVSGLERAVVDTRQRGCATSSISSLIRRVTRRVDGGLETSAFPIRP
jgi:hypothetical protein